MKIAVVVLAAFALTAGPAGEAGAQSPPKKAHKQAKARQPASAAAASSSANGYVERYADKLPYGSSAWWDQMLRESRAGTCCN